MANSKIGYGPNLNHSRNVLRDTVAIVKDSEKFHTKVKSLSLPQAMHKAIEENKTNTHVLLREVRGSIQVLYANLAKMNDEIKATTKCKESIEAFLNNIRRALMINTRCTSARSSRFTRSATRRDVADKQIIKEHDTLLRIKLSLETQLKSIQQLLTELDSIRIKLHKAIQQRNQSVAATQKQIVGAKSSTAIVEKYVNSIKATKNASDLNSNLGGGESVSVGQLLNQTRDTFKRAANVRQQSKRVIENATWIRQATHKAVDTSLRQNLRGLTTAKASVELQKCATRYSRLKQERIHEAIDRACGNQSGASTPTDKLQPLIPTTVNAGKLQFKDTAGELVGMLSTVNNNIQTLKMSEKKLNTSVSKKKIDTGIDERILRIRRMAKDHRWIATC